MSTVSPFSSLNTAFSGLQAAQAALNVTSKNIASVGVDGYSRQRVNQESIVPVGTYASIAPISGVTVTGYERIRDVLLDRRLYDQLPRSGDADARSSLLGQVELSFAEPGENGLQNLFGRFFNSFQAAANNPLSQPARQAVIDRARSLTDRINQLNTDMETVKSQIAAEQPQRVTQINEMAGQIASLNQDIQITTLHGGTASDLQDKRDQLIETLAEMGNLTVTNSTNGMVDIQFGSFSLVSGVAANSATLVDLNTATSGRMFALENLKSTVIPGLQTDLDGIALGLINQVNTLHQTGFDLSGNPGGVVFTGTGAANISLDSAWESDTGKLALSGSAFARGDNSVALAISQAGETSGVVGSQSINGAYSSLVSKMGSLVERAKSDSQVQRILSDAVKDKQSGVSGVSLDEEMSNLIKYQQSYGAAARAITAIDQMLEILVSRTGKVGM